MDSFGPTAKPYIVYDQDLTGFGLRVMPSGTKTWIVEYRPGAGGRKIFKRRMKIDLANRMPPDEARAHARDILARVRLGEDPAGVRATSRQTPTVSAFTERFLHEYAKPPSIKPNTRRLYSGNLLKLVGPAIGSLKLDAVTGPDIARLHRKLGRTTPTAANNMLVTLSSLYRYAAEVGVVAKGFNPTRNAVATHKTEKRERFLERYPNGLNRLGDSRIS